VASKQHDRPAPGRDRQGRNYTSGVALSQRAVVADRGPAGGTRAPTGGARESGATQPQPGRPLRRANARADSRCLADLGRGSGPSDAARGPSDQIASGGSLVRPHGRFSPPSRDGLGAFARRVQDRGARSARLRMHADNRSWTGRL